MAAIYRQEIIQDVSLFTSQSSGAFYAKLFDTLDFELKRKPTGRTGYPKEAMLCAFIVMKCEGFGYITDLQDYLENKTSDGHGGLRQKYCCPFRQSKAGVCPCDHPNWNNGRKNRGCTKYKTIPSDYRLALDRDSPRFKRIYALRSECERYNSRFKASGQERLWVRNAYSAANLNSIAHISALAVACAAVLLSPRHSYRGKKSLRRAA